MEGRGETDSWFSSRGSLVADRSVARETVPLGKFVWGLRRKQRRNKEATFCNVNLGGIIWSHYTLLTLFSFPSYSSVHWSIRLCQDSLLHTSHPMAMPHNEGPKLNTTSQHLGSPLTCFRLSQRMCVSGRGPGQLCY